MADLSGKKVLMIIAPKDFRDEEFFEPKKILEDLNVSVIVASKGVKSAEGMLGGEANVDIDISMVNVEDYAAVILIGGTGASTYFADAKAHSISREAFKEGKIIAAICIAPSTLANAGILKGKKATSWPSERENLESNGATYTGKDVTVDGRIVTAVGPKAAKEFGKKIAELLK